MSKKLSLTLTAIIATIGLTVFSVSNAFALDGTEQDTAPLTSAKQLCKEAKANYKKDKASMEEKGISQQMTTEQLAIELKWIKDYKNKVCKESKTTDKTCNKQYKKNVAWATAKGISLQLSEDEMEQLLQEIEQDKKICNGDPLTSPVQLCKEAKANYKKDKASIEAKGVSQVITAEQLAIELKWIKDYKKKVCKEAKSK